MHEFAFLFDIFGSGECVRRGALWAGAVAPRRAVRPEDAVAPENAAVPGTADVFHRGRAAMARFLDDVVGGPMNTRRAQSKADSMQ